MDYSLRYASKSSRRRFRVAESRAAALPDHRNPVVIEVRSAAYWAQAIHRTTRNLVIVAYIEIQSSSNSGRPRPPELLIIFCLNRNRKVGEVGGENKNPESKHNLERFELDLGADLPR